MRSSFVRDNAIRFRPELGRTGGEDMAFFHDVRQAGGRLRHAAKAVVVEELSRERERLGYQLHRQLFSELLSKDWPHGMEAAIDITLLGRYYERFADHAVSVARRVVYLVTGEREMHATAD